MKLKCALKCPRIFPNSIFCKIGHKTQDATNIAKFRTMMVHHGERRIVITNCPAQSHISVLKQQSPYGQPSNSINVFNNYMRRSKTIEFLVMLHHLHKNSKQVDVKFTKPVHKNANTRKLITKHRLKLYYCPKTKEGKKKNGSQ